MKYLLSKIPSFFFLICIGQIPCEAQENQTPSYGIKAGLNFSNLYTKNVDDQNMRTGISIGLFSHYPITNLIAIQPEFYFTTKGARVVYNGAFVDGTASFNLSYLEVPVLLAVSVSESVNLYAGPYASYLIGGNVQNESNINLFDFENNINIDDYNKFEAGIAIGGAIDIRAISLGVRYNYGLTKVGKKKTYSGTTYTFPDAKNSVFNLYVALSLR